MEYPKMKIYSGDKYIYFLMGYQLAMANNGMVEVGNDNGFVGGQKYYRRFEILTYENRTILKETKNTKANAEFFRYVEILHSEKERPSIIDFINEDGECGIGWVH